MSHRNKNDKRTIYVKNFELAEQTNRHRLILQEKFTLQKQKTLQSLSV